MTNLHDLHLRYGQSPWLDNLRRGWITGGELARWVERGVRGITSNPTIFQKAIAGSDEYDDQFGELSRAGTTPMDQPNENGNTFTALDRTTNPFTVAKLVYNPGNFGRQINQLTAYLDPDEDGVSGQDVAEWKCQLWQVMTLSVSLQEGQTVRPMHNQPVTVVAGACLSSAPPQPARASTMRAGSRHEMRRIMAVRLAPAVVLFEHKPALLPAGEGDDRLAGARAAVDAIEALRAGSLDVAPLQSYFKGAF